MGLIFRIVGAVAALPMMTGIVAAGLVTADLVTVFPAKELFMANCILLNLMTSRVVITSPSMHIAMFFLNPLIKI